MAIPTETTPYVVPKQNTKNKYLFPLILVTSLFFLWGFLHNLEPTLIPHLRRAFSLTTLQAAFVDSAVFIAYFIMAIPAGIIIKKYGYKSGILLGLFLFALGCFLFVPAANTMMYAFFLGALFIVACGLTILETAANPYATILGDPATSTQRLNFAQSFNGLAAFLAPLAGYYFILSKDPLSDEVVAKMAPEIKAAYLLSETSSVKMPYIILGCVILLIAAIFFFTKLPDIRDKEEKEGPKGFLHAFKHRHLTWAVIAQFCYVGAQVCITSFLILYATKTLNITNKEASYYSAAAGVAFMVGRFIGTALMQAIAPNRLMAIYAVFCVLLLGVTISGTGIITIYAIIGVAFFMSIMFPTIFALGIRDLGVDTKPAASLIIMSIVGGAIFPPLMGLIADRSGHFQYGYIVPLFCFAVVGWYAYSGYKIKQTVN